MDALRVLRTSVVVTLLLGACAPSLRKPKYGPHPAFGADPIFVEEPPPPAKVEKIPNPPSDERCVWVDGSWAFTPRGWLWQPGTWAIPPESCYFAHPAVGWLPSEGKGLLWYRPAGWFPEDDSGGPEPRQCVEPAPCVAGR